jgi:hypothetical protein
MCGPAPYDEEEKFPECEFRKILGGDCVLPPCSYCLNGDIASEVSVQDCLKCTKNKRKK